MHTRARGRVRNYGIACIGRLEVTAVLNGRFPPGVAVANGAFLRKIFWSICVNPWFHVV